MPSAFHHDATPCWASDEARGDLLGVVEVVVEAAGEDGRRQHLREGADAVIAVLTEHPGLRIGPASLRGAAGIAQDGL